MSNIFRSVARVAGDVSESRGFKMLGLVAIACLTLALGITPAFATAPTLPTTGVDLAAWIPVVVTAFGLTVLAIVGGYLAFLLIKKGMQWMRKSFG